MISFCCKDMMDWFKNGDDVLVEYGADFMSGKVLESYTLLVRTGDRVHNLELCPFCGSRIGLMIGSEKGEE